MTWKKSCNRARRHTTPPGYGRLQADARALQGWDGSSRPFDARYRLERLRQREDDRCDRVVLGVLATLALVVGTLVWLFT